jgi:Tol biopolymer transport system component
MDISPDGRFIVYDSFSGDAGGDRTLFLLSADGATERRLVNSPGNHLFPLWTADGKHIVYASDRSGTMDAWELKIENGEPRGEPRLLRRDLGRFLPMNITASGGLYYGLRTGSTDVFVSTLAAPARNAKRATLRFPGRNTTPAWSPDGASLAYLSRRGSENFGQESRAIVIRRLGSEEERELPVKLAHMERIRWSPTSRALLVSGSDNKGRGGLFLVDVETAAVKPFAVEPGAPFRGFDAVWSRDGKSVLYLHPSGELRKRETETGHESTLYRGAGLSHIAASPDGKWLAVGEGGKALVVIPAAGGEAKTLPFEGLTDIEWGHELVGGKGPELWRIPLDGGLPVRLDSPGNRDSGFSLHPDGERLALTAGDSKSEIWVLPLR